MLFHELTQDTFVEVTSDLLIGNNIIPYANFALWTDDELHNHGVYKLEYPAVPDGKYRTGYSVQRIDSVVQIVGEYADVPTPEPQPYRITKFTFIDRLVAAGLLEAAFTAIGGPGSVQYERWQASASVDPLNEDVIAVLTAIGGDLTTLLAPE